MQTRIITIDPENIDMDKLSEAAGIIRNGGLVAFPTETVYGLGADAMNEKAVRSIFEAKGRPPDNPLIVHVSSFEDITPLVDSIPDIAERLSARFWPGPLSMIMKKSASVPPIVTAGLDTVAIRVPSHPVTIEFLKLCKCPVAAPSANTSGKPSPTKARHVFQDLEGKVAAIIDAGSSPLGLESTVLDITGYPPVILRPGAVTQEQIDSHLGISTSASLCDSGAPRSPGMKYRHYSPQAEMIIVEGDPKRVSETINALAGKYVSTGIKTAIMTTEENAAEYAGQTGVYSMGRAADPETVAKGLYDLLRMLDALGYGVILAEALKKDGIGAAVMNRMYKASGYNIIKAGRLL